jgi:Uma2 family endonuclease
MGEPALKRDDTYTYGQYRLWSNEERWELIDGIAWAMSAPTPRHQFLFIRLVRDFANFLDGKPCKLLAAPCDVLFPEGDEDDDSVTTVVQPDLMVFCDESKIHAGAARGAPDLVVEILSPSTAKKDLNEKFNLYERYGVREYWVIDPAARTITVYRRTNRGRFDHGELREPFQKNQRAIESSVLEGFRLEPEPLFENLP